MNDPLTMRPRDTPVFAPLQAAARLGTIALCIAGCSVQAPATSNETPVGAAAGRYGSVAACTPSMGCANPPCTTNPAIGAPDGSAINVGDNACNVLDVVITGGTIVASGGQVDLIVHLGQTGDASLQLSASTDGISYEIVGYINGIPPGAAERCLATNDGAKALIDLKANSEANVGGCNHVANVRHLRFSRLGGAAVQGVIEIDAVEANPCSFVPQGQQMPDCSASAG